MEGQISSIGFGRLSPLSLITMAVVFLGVALPSSDAVGKQKTLKELIVGTWTYVSVDTVRPDGSRVPMYGLNPRGLASFDSNGRYMLLVARPDQPKFASNNRTECTPEENNAVLRGSIAHFGRYTVNEADKTITFHIETSTFPNLNGVEQKLPLTLSGDQLKWTALVASGGGSGEAVLNRAK